MRKAHWSSHLNEPPWLLDERARCAALEAILSVCQYRQWMVHAVHIRTTHVHAVIGGDAIPEKMLSDFKAYATRALRAAGVLSRRRFWANHGSTRYLWNDCSLKAAVEYVVNGQGERMACYWGEPKVSF